MKKYSAKCFLIGLVLLSTSLYAAIEPAECAILRSRGAGMFSVFMDVLALLQNHEKGVFKSIKIDFANEGQYFEPSVGQNWWEYYFEPINNQNSHKTKEYYYLDCWKIQFCNTRNCNNYLIEKYIKIKPNTQEKIDSFVNSYFKSSEFIIGVHYRGTDKVVAGSEAPRVPYASVVEVLKKQIDSLLDKNYLIFIATDELDFIHYVNKKFPGRVCANMEAHEIHDNYHRGQQAVIDCVLLSKSDLIIRTDSNLSLCSSFFNFKVPVIELSKGFWQPSEGCRCE